MPHNKQSLKINFNCNNMIDPIEKIILKHPKTAFINQNCELYYPHLKLNFSNIE